MKNTPSFRRFGSRPRGGERGAVLIMSLIMLVVMLISAAALVRSFDVSLGTAGNLAFKRDLAQQSEQATQTILTEFRAGGALVTSAARANPLKTQNYSAVALPSNPQGIPLALLNDETFDDVATTAKDIESTGQSIRLRYVIDRLCTTVGEDAALGADFCTVADSGALPGGSSSDWQRAERSSGAASGAGLSALPTPVVYRLSIRATGPRNTQSFFQTTFSCCDS